MRGAARQAGSAFAATLATGLAAALLLAPAAQAQPEWRAAESLRSALFAAQSKLLVGESAAPSVQRARRALAGGLARVLERDNQSAFRDLRGSLGAAARAAASRDPVGLAAARGRANAALLRGSFAVTLAAVARGDAKTARAWLLIREFRTATRFSRPGIDATEAVDALSAGTVQPAQAEAAVRKDLFDSYQSRLSDHLDDAEQAESRGFASRAAETAAVAAGFWPILAPRYVEQRGGNAESRMDVAFARLSASAAEGDGRAFARSLRRVRAGLDGFTAAAFSAEEQARRASQLTRFIDLIPFEYDHGTDDGRVTIPFELQEALAFQDAAEAALTDLTGTLIRTDAAGVAAVESALADLRRYSVDAAEGRSVASQEDVDAAHETAATTLDRILPAEWRQSSDEADFELIDISLNQMEAAAGAGEYERAEQARLAAYGFLDFGPELKLKAFDPQLAVELEGLFWYGAGGAEGFAQLIADEAPAKDLHETRLVLDEKLATARGILGESGSKATAITNSALIVFREGLEAILIIAAITASLLGPQRRLRRPILRGALLAVPASIVLWLIAQTVLTSLARYGEKLEAVVGLLAIAVLLLVLNWFFHKVYWTQWIAGHRERGRRMAAGTAAGVASATVLGLYLLGFSSVLREGFETVLFLQALQLSFGTGVVLAGVTLGLIVTGAVGAITFKLEQRLPYKRMLVVTGVLISLVLVVMVGNTVRVMQGVGWAPITPIHVDLPLWMGTWLGIFPTVETLVAQGAALVFVIGSYYLAEWVRKRQVRGSVSGNGRVDEHATAAVRARARGALSRDRRGGGARLAAGRPDPSAHDDGPPHR